MTETPTSRVLVTGANGNLGRKLVAHLAASPWCAGIVAVDLAGPDHAPHPKVRPVAVDLSRRSPTLDDAVAGVDAVVHLAARNPYPDADWDDAAVSFDMTLQVVESLRRRGGAARFVFTSSNHVMGGYKEEAMAPGSLTTALPPRPGTRTVPGDVPRAYAAAKLMGERLLAARAEHGTLTAVSLRIGWCQPGDNRPETLSASGIPGEAGPDTPLAARELAWFRAMWLSNGDFLRAVSAALGADAEVWPTPAVVVNAMSDNAGMPWDIAETRRLIGYAPQDDATRLLARGAA